MSGDSERKPFRIAIIGGGIGGLALAVSLGRYIPSSVPFHIDLYESAPAIPTIGAGITVWPRTWEIFSLLGLEPALKEHAVDVFREPNGGVLFRRSDRRLGRDAYLLKVASEYTAKAMHRTAMVKLLESALPPSDICTVHTSRRLVAYDDKDASQPIVLTFENGAVDEADLLIGADGVRSVVRRGMFGQSTPFSRAKWTGSLAYRFLAQAADIREKARENGYDSNALNGMVVFCGKLKHLVTYPITPPGSKQATLVNVVAFVTVPGKEYPPPSSFVSSDQAESQSVNGGEYPGRWVTDVDSFELWQEHHGWEQEAEDLILCATKPSRWAIHIIDGLPSYSHSRVAILGDAAHAMTTHFGAGAGQAVEDAFALARLIGAALNAGELLRRAPPPPFHQELQQALSLYDKFRRPVAENIVRRASYTGCLYEFDMPGIIEVIDESREEDIYRVIGEAVNKEWAWQGRAGVGAEVEALVRCLQEV